MIKKIIELIKDALRHMIAYKDVSDTVDIDTEACPFTSQRLCHLQQGALTRTVCCCTRDTHYAAERTHIYDFTFFCRYHKIVGYELRNEKLCCKVDGKYLVPIFLFFVYTVS